MHSRVHAVDFLETVTEDSTRDSSLTSRDRKPEIVTNDRQLRRTRAQPQLGTRSGHAFVARHRFLQAADAPVYLEALPKHSRVFLSLQPLDLLASRRYVPPRGTHPPDGARPPPPLSPVGTGMARRQHLLWQSRNLRTCFSRMAGTRLPLVGL